MSDQKATPGATELTGEGSVGLSAEPSRPPELPSNQKAWDVLSDVEKARRYAAEYRANPAKRADAIHTHWLMVLDDEIERLSQANKANFDATMDNGQMAREIAQLRKDYARLINTSKTGGSDTCITCAAHVLVITEDLEPEIERLRNGLRRLAGDLSDGPTRRIAQAILDGSPDEMGNYNADGSIKTVPVYCRQHGRYFIAITDKVVGNCPVCDRPMYRAADETSKANNEVKP